MRHRVVLWSVLMAALPACSLLVGGDEKILVDDTSAKGGRPGAGGFRSGAGGGANNGGAGRPAGGGAPTGGAGASGSTAGSGGTPSGGTAAGGKGDVASGGSGGTGSGGAGSTAATGGQAAGGAPFAGGGTGKGGADGKGGEPGKGGGSGKGGGGGEAGKGGSAGTSGATAGSGGASGTGAAGAPTAPGGLDCQVAPPSVPLCTTFGPPPDKWEKSGCKTLLSEGSNQYWQWNADTGTKCSGFVSATLSGAPSSATLSFWVRVPQLKLSDASLDLATVKIGTHPGATLALRIDRDASMAISGTSLTVRMPGVDPAVIGPLPLGQWRQVKLQVAVLDAGNGQAKGTLGAAGSGPDASQTVSSAAAATTGPTHVEMVFIQQDYVSGPTKIDLDDLTVSYP